MSVSGLCEICESRQAEYGCDRCGTMTCELHFDQSRGVCATCARQMGDPVGGGREDHDDPSPGDTYQM